MRKTVIPNYHQLRSIKVPLRSRGGVVTTNLLAWWKHNEGTGTVLNDYQGSYDGTIVGANFWANTAPDGSPIGTYEDDDNYVNGIGDTLAIPSGGITIVTIVYHNHWAVQDVIFGKRKGAGAAVRANYLLGVYFADATEVSFAFTENNTATWHLCNTTDFNPSDDTWYILTVSYTFGTGSSIKIYNGTTELGTNWSAGDGDAVHTDVVTKYVILGGVDVASPGDDVATTNFWDGRIGDVLFYNKALSLAEVTQNYNTLKDRYSL